jgi:Tfp pilus assembly protein PilW
MTPSRRRAGMTLVELLVGLALTVLLLRSVTALLRVNTAAAGSAAEQLDLQEQAQFAVRRIARRIDQTPATMLAPKGNDATSAGWLAPALYDLRNGTAPGTLALCETLAGSGVTTTRVLAEPATSLVITSAPVSVGRTLVTVSLTLVRGNASAGAAVTVRLGGAL